MRTRVRLTMGLAFAVSCQLSAVSYAQDVALPEPVGREAAKDGEPEIALDVDREIDLANVVTSAAKGVTTVQEAPSIITIITADEIRARGFRWLGEALGTVPGWIDIHAIGHQVPNALVRGIGQAALLMRDGMSLFDPWANIGDFGRTQPLETIKRLEVVTGPGGVLWGANSFLGIVNMITKDAEDVNGLEMAAGYGDGSGNKQDIKAYALFGKTFFSGKLKIFQHVSYESFIGPVFDIPQFIVSSPAPQPPGLAYWGANAPRDPPRSWYAMVDGKYTLGPVSLYYSIPFGDNHPNLVFANAVVTQDQINIYDRYGMLEYKDRYLKDRVGLTVKAYGTQFVRDFSVQLFPSSAFFGSSNPDPRDMGLSPGGLHFSFSTQRVFRVGGTADLDFVLPFNIRLLAGGEFFFEGIRDSPSVTTQPTDPNNLPLVCPVDSMGMRIQNCPRTYEANSGRYVAAGYVNAQWRPFQKLTLDGGVRLQKGFGDLAYAFVPLGSAAIVYNFLPDYHVKLNYATGFRAPVFQVTSVLAGGVSYGANPKLRTESSQSFQGEVNARLLRNVRKVRELELRADYSYTLLSDVIQIRGGLYGNLGKRAIHSVEGYAKLYLNGDHFLQAAYTYLQASTTDSGVVRATPNHTFVVGGSFNLIKGLLDVNMNLMIFGAYEDPNRFASGGAGAAAGKPTTVGTTTGAYSDLTWDRLTPVANLQLGFRLRFLKDRVQFSGQFYNVLNQRYYYPDNFYDITPSVEMTPNPAPGFNFFASLSYHF
ncbi:MAG: TonB-dependent receptor [Myxococcales bacterium]|nr:TonB-dependent receptor [Myxococcales bacterium]